MRVTKRTNIAMRVLMHCAANSGRLVTKAEIARVCNVSENHVAQIVNQLGQLGFLHTRRGRNGGLELGRPASEIGVGAVFRALEAGMPLTECFAEADNSCPLTEACRLRAVLARAARAFFEALDPVTLEDLVGDNAALIALLTQEDAAAAPCARRPGAQVLPKGDMLV